MHCNGGDYDNAPAERATATHLQQWRRQRQRILQQRRRRRQRILQQRRRQRTLCNSNNALYNNGAFVLRRRSTSSSLSSILLDKVYKLSQEWGNIHVIIAGDLNSVPKSAIYKFLSSSKIMEEPKGYEEMRNIFRSQIPDDASISMTLSRQLLYRWSVEELRLATGAKGITYLQHLLKLRSAIVVFLYAVLICQIKLLPLAISATSL